jgi:hypothetical protein
VVEVHGADGGGALEMVWGVWDGLRWTFRRAMPVNHQNLHAANMESKRKWKHDCACQEDICYATISAISIHYFLLLPLTQRGPQNGSQ